ncbi:CLUMA_CG003157, isoform A [Clunio marinus]|uniref:CLUMA_CG003157, isoform A n=1 Tax=Clunio marinus TaxID=568069 RepID=A0A1J1HMX5_9DIPT|nr:CLUMA_CG003157, isoform A [Clunio marinus]
MSDEDSKRVLNEPTDASIEVPNNADNKKTLKDVVLDGLEEKGKGKDCWLWVLFILCITPNIINGFHISSYVFLIPESYFCLVPELHHKNWTNEQIREIAVPGGLETNQSCEVYMWDYEKFSDLSYAQAKSYLKGKHKPETKSCFEMKDTINDDYAFHFEQEKDVSFVPEWNLVCERTALRSNVQVALSIGKFVGASTFGIISDKYGRKMAFNVAATLYILSGLLTTFSPTYIFLIIGRIGLGFCGSGVFYSLFTLITENSGQKYRSSLSIAYNFSYPLGFLFLAFAAYITPHWRDLSLVLTIPSFLLIIHLIWLVESPRYLISKGKYKKAYLMLYRKKPSPDYLLELQCDKEAIIESMDEKSSTVSFADKIGKLFHEIIKIYGPATLRRKALICHFTWCVTSLTYYMLALNAENFKANIYIWTGLTGTVDIFGYIVSIFILKWSTRRLSQFTLFVLAGAFLLFVLAIAKEAEFVLLVFAMMSRFCITSVYAIMTLHTAEMFPTEVRNSVLGISSTAAHFGSFFAPYIVDLLGPIAWYMPTTICGTLVVAAGFLTLFQPETKGHGLTDHVHEDINRENDDADVEMNSKN